MSTLKVGLFGGSFNPVHKGHLAIAKAILKDGCDEVWFLPCVQSPFKEQASVSFEDRVEMIEAMIAPYKKMKVCTIEKYLDVPSYTVHTLTVLKKYYDYQYVFYIGNDQAALLDDWKDIQTCFKLAQFKVFARDEAEIDDKYKLAKVSLPLIDISSTQVRSGQFHKTSRSVQRIIWKKGLYLETWVQSSMSEKRFKHSKSVADLSMQLAICHQVDPDLAYRSGLLHDLCKEWPLEKLVAYMQCYDPDLLDQPMALYHGYVVRHYLSRIFSHIDKALLVAVSHHVTGTTCSKLAMIVYLADKLDPSRGYDSSEQIASAKVNLMAAYRQAQIEQASYIKKENQNGSNII